MNNLSILVFSLVGSRAYGIHMEDSDYDYSGIFLQSLDCYIKPSLYKEYIELSNYPVSLELPEQAEGKLYNIKRYIDLALKNNPNILELLWIKPEYKKPAIKTLIDNRRLLISKRVRNTYSGYAYAQIQKAQKHFKWLKADPSQYEKYPNPKDYGLDGNSLTKGEKNAFLHFLSILIKDAVQYYDLHDLIGEKFDPKTFLLQESIPTELFNDIQKCTRSTNDFIKLLHSTQEYEKAVSDYKAFHSWKTNRNPERAALEAKIGYDSKNLSHCIRLLKTGIELLQGQDLIVDRREAGDAEYLKQVRYGQVSYEEVLSYSTELFNQIKIIDTQLPEYPNTDLFESILFDIIENYA